MNHIYLTREFEAAKKFYNMYQDKDNYLILEAETTGLGNNDEIIEIAIIDLYGNVLLNTYVYSEKKISKSAYLINFITKEMLIGKPTIKELTPIISDIVKDKIILTYNSEFHTRMLYQSGYTGGIKTECLMELYGKYFYSQEQRKWVSLKNALRYENIGIIQTHGALVYCQQCLSIINSIGIKFKSIMEKYNK